MIGEESLRLSEGGKTKLKSPIKKSDEAELLQNLVRKFVEEKKFNDIYHHEDEQSSVVDLEISQLTNLNESNALLS